MSKNQQVTLNCKRCGKEFKCSPSHVKLRKNCSLYCSNHGVRKNTGRTHFKKEMIPWNKDKLKSNPKQRRQWLYRRLLLEVSDNPCCIRCGESEKRLLVHHKDKNVHNNDLENIEILCYSCHSKEHQIYKNFIKEVITNE